MNKPGGGGKGTRIEGGNYINSRYIYGNSGKDAVGSCVKRRPV